MTKYGFAINLFRCIGCRTCTISCKMENHLADGVQRVHVLNDEGTLTLDTPSGTYPDLSFTWRPVPCQQCDNPACIDVCPVEGATYKRDDGVVVVDKDACIGCGSCVEACPYGARTLDPETSIVDKCDMCLHRLTNGVDRTMCALCCPNRAITAGDLDDPDSEVSKLVASFETEQYLVDEGTGPNVYYYRSVKPQNTF